MQTPERFRSLASRVLAARTPAPDEPAFEIVEELLEPADDDAGDPRSGEEELELARDVRLFHARVIEAVEAAVETLVADIAADILGRELRLEPVDIEQIVDRALQRFAAEEPLRVRVHADDAGRLNCGLPVAADMRLRPGDAVIELRNGSADASLGVRLAALVRKALE
ncbi:MAG TPA: FliH/SctL family protein [Candidatus Baltobacteraceae bacterium]|nr:FliH/SctL family protein [Candidatus Baltobacteraceae bacterium]